MAGLSVHVLPALVDTYVLLGASRARALSKLLGEAAMVVAWLGAAFVPRGANGCVLWPRVAFSMPYNVVVGHAGHTRLFLWLA